MGDRFAVVAGLVAGVGVTDPDGERDVLRVLPTVERAAELVPRPIRISVFGCNHGEACRALGLGTEEAEAEGLLIPAVELAGATRSEERDRVPVESVGRALHPDGRHEEERDEGHRSDDRPREAPARDEMEPEHQQQRQGQQGRSRQGRVGLGGFGLRHGAATVHRGGGGVDRGILHADETPARPDSSGLPPRPRLFWL